MNALHKLPGRKKANHSVELGRKETLGFAISLKVSDLSQQRDFDTFRGLFIPT